MRNMLYLQTEGAHLFSTTVSKTDVLMLLLKNKKLSVKYMAYKVTALRPGTFLACFSCWEIDKKGLCTLHSHPCLYADESAGKNISPPHLLLVRWETKRNLTCGGIKTTPIVDVIHNQQIHTLLKLINTSGFLVENKGVIEKCWFLEL